MKRLLALLLFFAGTAAGQVPPNMADNFPCKNDGSNCSTNLPNQAGHSGEFLTTNGSTTSWAVVGGSGSCTACIAGDIPRWSGAAFIQSLLHEDGVTFTYAGAGGIVAAAYGGPSAALADVTFQANQPPQIAGATNGNSVTVAASSAIAGSSVNGAANGGLVLIQGGDADRLVSGDANGGDIRLAPGAGVGAGLSGSVLFPLGSAAAPALGPAAYTGVGLHFTATAAIWGRGAGNIDAAIAQGMATTSGGCFSWSSSATDATASAQAALCNTAGVISATTGSLTANALSGTPALPDGTTATTQVAGSNDTKVATDAYVDTGLALKAPLASPVFTGTVQVANGTAAAPGLALSGSAYGFFTGTNITATYNNHQSFSWRADSLGGNSSFVWGWASGASPDTQSLDTGLSRGTIAASVHVGNGTAGDDTGKLAAAVIGRKALAADTATSGLRVHGQNAWSQATVNTAGSSINVSGGLGRRFITFVTPNSTGATTLTFTANAVSTVLTEGTDYNCNTLTTTQCATNLAAAVAANGTLGPLMTATPSAAIVYLDPKITLDSLSIVDSAGAAITETSGTDGNVIFPNGSATTPGLAFQTGNGIYSGGGGSISVSIGGGAAYQFAQTVLQPVTDAAISLGDSTHHFTSGFFSGNVVNAGLGGGYQATSNSGYFEIGSDTLLTRHAAANWQLGNADGAAPIAQTLSAQSVAAGTADTAGPALTFQAPLGTGTGASSGFVFKVPTPQTTGSTQQPTVTALTIVDSGSAGTSKPQVIVPAGIAATPGIAISGDTQTGFAAPGGAQTISYVAGGAEKIRFGSSPSLFLAGNNGLIQMGASADVRLSRRAAATWQLGDADAAAPVAQTLAVQGPRLGVDTDVAGGNLTIQSGIGTGAAVPADITLKTTVTGTTGTTAETQLAKFVVHNKNYAAADNTNVPIFTVSLPTANTGCATHTSFTYTAADATHNVTHTGIYIWAFTNENGTVSGSVTDSGEAVAGTGCGAACDTSVVTVATTTATANINFNNTLSVTGNFTFQVLNNSCTTLTFQ